MSVIQDLYDSEINLSVATFWDGGFTVKLGDEINGFRAQANFNRWDQVEPWLAENAVKHFPDSAFAEAYRWHGTRAPRKGTAQ